MTALSVVWPTYRMGGMDYLAASFLRQEDPPPYEIVLVDSLHAVRASRFLLPLQMPIKHVAPHGRVSWPYYHVCASRNTGILAAEGHTVLVTVDWVEASSRWLHRMYDAVQSDPAAVWIGAHPHRTVTDADVHYGTFEEYDRAISHQAFLQNDLWFLRHTRPALDEPGGIYEHFEHGDEVHPRHFFAKNFACRKQILQDVGLFDERFDGAHGLDDWDLADRLVAAGIRLRFCADAAVRVFKPATTVIPRLLETRDGNGGVFGRDAGPTLPEMPLRVLKEKRLA